MGGSKGTRGTAAGSWCKQVAVRCAPPPPMAQECCTATKKLFGLAGSSDQPLCEVSIPAGFAVVAPKLVPCQAAEHRLAEMQLPGGAFLGRCVPALVML